MTTLGYTILENQKKIMSEQVIGLGTTVVTQLASSSKEMVLSDDTLGLQTLINNLIDKKSILGAVIIADDGQILATAGSIPGEHTTRLYRKKTTALNKINHFEWRWNISSDNSHKLVTFISPIHFKRIISRSRHG